MAPQSTGGEHHVRMPAHGGGQAATGDTPPEKQLNGFVRVVALIERLGNAFGTLAFTWATVVLLGGYPTVLRTDNNFWFATAIVFLEAARCVVINTTNFSDHGHNILNLATKFQFQISDGGRLIALY